MPQSSKSLSAGNPPLPCRFPVQTPLPLKGSIGRQSPITLSFPGPNASTPQGQYRQAIPHYPIVSRSKRLYPSRAVSAGNPPLPCRFPVQTPLPLKGSIGRQIPPLPCRFPVQTPLPLKGSIGRQSPITLSFPSSNASTPQGQYRQANSPITLSSQGSSASKPSRT